MLEVVFLCDAAFYKQASAIMNQADVEVQVKRIMAGKLRRYNTMPWWKYLRHPSIMLKNLRDSFLLAIGFMQSLWLIASFRPQVIFTKGGFVCVPVGVAAKIMHTPLVIHDSDAHPGLTNRILARFASSIATGYPLEHYHYPKNISHYVGIPISETYQKQTAIERLALKKKHALPLDKPLLLVTGGGLGARNINNAVFACIELGLLESVTLIHVAGVANFDEINESMKQRPGYFVYPFVDSSVMADYINASDIVVTRAGATTLLELSAAAKAVIIIPNPLLTGGHQLKNAEVYSGRNAAIVLDENRLKQSPRLLLETVRTLLASPEQQALLARNNHTLAKPDAAKEMVRIILKASKKK